MGTSLVALLSAAYLGIDVERMSQKVESVANASNYSLDGILTVGTVAIGLAGYGLIRSYLTVHNGGEFRRNPDQFMRDHYNRFIRR